MLEECLIIDPLFAFIVALTTLLIGLSKGGMGAAIVVLVTPLLTLVMPVRDALSLALPLLILADGFALWFYWRMWDMRYIRLLTPMAIVGIVIGTFFLATLDNRTLKYILAAFTIGFVIYRVFGSRLMGMGYSPRAWHGYLAGGATGLGSALANTGAPPYTAYMLLQDLTPTVFVGTTTLFFAIVNLVKLPGLIAAGLMDFDRVIAVAWVTPLVPLGVWLGRRLIRRIDKTAFERFMLVILAIAGGVLILTA